MEWTADIESLGGLTSDEDDAERLLEALERSPKALGPAVAFHLDREALSAIFQVVADDPAAAARIAVETFVGALTEARVGPEKGGGKLLVIAAEVLVDRLGIEKVSANGEPARRADTRVPA